MDKIAFLFLISLLVITTPTLAKEGKGEGGDNKAKVEIKIKNESNAGQKNEVKIKLRSNNQTFQKIEIKNDKFEIEGEVSTLSGNNFTVASQTIFIDPSKVKEFEQKGVLKEGVRIKVEGEIIDGVKFAREIKVLRDGQVIFPLASVSPSSTPSGNPSPTASASANFTFKIKAQGPIEQVISFLEQILNSLKSLL